VMVSGINWSAVKFKRRRPSWRQRVRNTTIVSNGLAYLTSRMRRRAGKDLRKTKVSAPDQADVGEMTDEYLVRLAQQGDVAATARFDSLNPNPVRLP
jgi:hypothetical protein